MELQDAEAAPVPDRLTAWPIDHGLYGLDAIFEGDASYERARAHRVRLEGEGVPQRLRRELNGGWTLRFGPLRGADVAGAFAAFV